MLEASEGSRGWYDADSVDLGGGRVNGNLADPGLTHHRQELHSEGHLGGASALAYYLYITEQQLVVFTR